MKPCEYSEFLLSVFTSPSNKAVLPTEQRRCVVKISTLGWPFLLLCCTEPNDVQCEIQRSPTHLPLAPLASSGTNTLPSLCETGKERAYASGCGAAWLWRL
eukprot:1911439-Rhodomonas_salina.1